MNHPELSRILENYGLKERHAKIYLALLSLGSASIQKISLKSGFARSTCEAVLVSLQRTGFATSFRKKSIRYFSAEDPRKIISMAEHKAELLKHALPKFLNLYHSQDNLPAVRFYEGKAGMQTIMREILDEAKEMICFGSADSLYETLLSNVENFIDERIKRKIPLRLILQDSPFAQKRKSLEDKLLMKVKIVPNTLKMTSVMWIWNNKIAMFSLQKDIVALVVQSEELAKMHRAMFELVWES
jgi:sugar-specific transcriptional regulator TrmB